MTVGDLIAELRKFEPNRPIAVYNYHGVRKVPKVEEGVAKAIVIIPTKKDA